MDRQDSKERALFQEAPNEGQSLNSAMFGQAQDPAANRDPSLEAPISQRLDNMPDQEMSVLDQFMEETQQNQVMADNEFGSSRRNPTPDGASRTDFELTPDAAGDESILNSMYQPQAIQGNGQMDDDSKNPFDQAEIPPGNGDELRPDDIQLDITPQVSKETRGGNLGQIKDDMKSQAYTEKFQGVNGDLLYNREEEQDKYSEGGNLKPQDKSDDDLKFFGEEEEEIQPKNTLDIQNDQVQDLIESWEYIKTHKKLEELGLRTMKNLFTISPRMIGLFSFRDEENLYRSPMLKEHYLKVLAAVESTIYKMLDTKDDLKETLKSLGADHRRFGVQKNQFEVFGKALIQALESVLKQRLTFQVRQSWTTFLMIVTSHMVSDNFEWEPKDTISEEKLTPLKIRLIQSSWKMMLQEKTSGITIFKNFFTLEPSAIAMFKFEGIKDLYNSFELNQHSQKVLKVLTHILDNFENQESLKPLIKKLGVLHGSKGVTEEKYKSLAQAILMTVHEIVGDEMTKETKRAWDILLQTLATAMLEVQTEEFSPKKSDIEPSRDDLSPGRLDKFQEQSSDFQTAQKPAETKQYNTPYYSQEEIKIPDEVYDSNKRNTDGEKIMPVKRQSLKELFYEQQVDPDIEDGDKEISDEPESQGGQNLGQEQFQDFQEDQRLIQGDHDDMIPQDYANPLPDDQAAFEQPLEGQEFAEPQLNNYGEEQLQGEEQYYDQQYNENQQIDPNYGEENTYGQMSPDYPQEQQQYQQYQEGDMSLNFDANQTNQELLADVTYEEGMGEGIVEGQQEQLHQSPEFNEQTSQRTPPQEEGETPQDETPQEDPKPEPEPPRPSQAPRESQKMLIGQSLLQPSAPRTSLDKLKAAGMGRGSTSNSLSSMNDRTPRRRDQRRSSRSVIPLDDKKKDISNNKTGPRPSVVKYTKELFTTKFRKEVDFHHKISYRFEKAYRLRKKNMDSWVFLNIEIVECISEHSGYIESDPMVFFYCLFFCIYYRNEKLVEFFRQLIQKTQRQNKKTDQLLEYIDMHGVERIRTVGEQINNIVYHMVFYQAIDDDLRIVYSQILRQLRFIQMRDKDALQLLNMRDYDLIQISFEKFTTKINLGLFYKQSFSMKSSTYRKYNRAFFEEIVINYDIEPRVARNYREKFLVTAEDIYNVFEMYCKEDYDAQFISTKKDDITKKQFVDLFIICLKNDSSKIALIIYLNFLNHTVDMDKRMLDIILLTIKDSVKFHEIKLFLIHQHFDSLSVMQMNQLLDIYQDILSQKDAMENPMISQFNTIKITLLIYRICWKIEEKQIYSLITKCSVLQAYLIKSLFKYFESQNNIMVLHKFMSEPILHLSEHKDSLDIMYEMNMKEMLQHPVVVEVINLVYEGEYSISATALTLSKTCQFTLEMGAFNQKSICKNVLTYISGGDDSKKQSSLMFNIWKQSIVQRESDEMVFTIIIHVLIIVFSGWVNQLRNLDLDREKDIFGDSISIHPELVLSVPASTLATYCEDLALSMAGEEGVINSFNIVNMVTIIGMMTSVMQRLTVYKFKDNVSLDQFHIILELGIVMACIFFRMTVNQDTGFNTQITDLCASYVDFSAEQIQTVNKIQTLRFPMDGAGGVLSFNSILAILIILSAISILFMLQRTTNLGQVIMLLAFMLSEIVRFFSVFGIFLGVFVIIGKMLDSLLRKKPENSYWQSFIVLYRAFNGDQVIDLYTYPVGSIYIASYIYIFQIFLFSLLISMFINRQFEVSKNLDAYRRFNIIKLKNSDLYDQYIGGVTLTFFPINILMLPFMFPVVAFRNPRISDFALKLQYGVMMLLYFFISLLIIIPLLPLLYIKMALNSFYILSIGKRQEYPGQNMKNALTSIFLGPIIVVASFFNDLATIPSILLKPNEEFELKYQLSEQKVSGEQQALITGIFERAFKREGKKMKEFMLTIEQLMIQHQKQFKIIDNLHDLMCKGDMDYKKALSIVQDYNMSKILAKKFSVPDRNGKFKLGKFHLFLLNNVFMDIKIYNYADHLLRLRSMGILTQQLSKGTLEAENIKKQNDLEEIQARQAKDEENGLKPTDVGPDGVLMFRNVTDYMNNFFIDIISMSYLDTANSLNVDLAQVNQERIKLLAIEVEKKQEEMKVKAVTTVEVFAENIFQKAQELFDRQKENSSTGTPKTSTLDSKEEDLFKQSTTQRMTRRMTRTGSKKNDAEMYASQKTREMNRSTTRKKSFDS